MRSLEKDKIGFLLALFLIGVIYLKTIIVDIDKFVIYSNITQNVNFHIKTEYQKSRLSCNKKSINIDINKKHNYFYRGEEQITISLHRGKNICEAKDIKDIRQKINFIDFITLFMLLGVPILILIFYIFTYFLDKINIKITSPTTIDRDGSKWIFGIILLGIAIRIIYFEKYGVILFQHDWQGHVNLIQYLASTHTLPDMPNKGWEYPQQPLYYIITGSIYYILDSFHFAQKEILNYIGYFSLLCSFIFLYYSHRLLELLTANRWVQTISMLFLALTPSLVYMSVRINNDILVMALSSIALFYTIKAYQNGFKRYFYTALSSVSLLFLTKISTASIELLLFALLIINYIETKERLRLFIFSLVGVLLLSWTLWHLYTPLNETFYMVNSTKFPKQTIEHLDSSYLFSFHIFDLIKEGYSFVFGNNEIRYSFPTYQYGTMFFGEFDYRYFINRADYMLIVMQSILLFGLLYIIGSISYLVNIYRENLESRLLFAILIINLILILKFVFTYPSICNTDFRYFVSSFIIFGFIFAKGLYHLSTHHKYIGYIINSILSLLFINELIFFYGLTVPN